ncbi:MFS transporter [Pseudonocardia parietis]|uniref:CP family cyanate transporter-like MFS transporter n=1 Tax=Pseudonocardia parietis TaxID=570936 RepID=A0ABS4VSU0_9PSEU|nr:MFS transporter [Pseudonocardia parietis]MBP2366991.1 CP family cyanate transporter-like MFS transporter [Pseudonocardia parietis]
MSTTHPTSTRSAVAPALLITAIVLLALNLRGPIVAVSAVTGEVQAGLGVDAATVGLLTSLPVLCFGLATPAASLLLARLGLGRGVLIALVVLAAGIVLRSLGGFPEAIAGTLLIGAAVTVGNVAVPVVIGRDLPQRAGPVLGLYTATLNVGSMTTLSLTAPIAGATDWRFALAVWAGLVLVAGVAWWLATRDLCEDDDSAATDTGPSVEASGPLWWRRPVVWGLTVAFAGQAFAYYGVTAWLPVLLTDELGMTSEAAGFSASLFQISAIAGAFGVPVLLRVCPAPWMPVALVGVVWTALPLGLLLAPQSWPVWSVLGGAAQGGGITVIFALVVRRARDLAENRRMSALVQGGGYLVAATGPFVVGAAYEYTGGWDVPMLIVLGALLVLLVVGTATAVIRTPRDAVRAAR